MTIKFNYRNIKGAGINQTSGSKSENKKSQMFMQQKFGRVHHDEVYSRC